MSILALKCMIINGFIVYVVDESQYVLYISMISTKTWVWHGIVIDLNLSNNIKQQISIPF